MEKSLAMGVLLRVEGTASFNCLENNYTFSCDLSTANFRDTLRLLNDELLCKSNRQVSFQKERQSLNLLILKEKVERTRDRAGTPEFKNLDLGLTFRPWEHKHTTDCKRLSLGQEGDSEIWIDIGT